MTSAITPDTTLAELAEILRAKGVHSLRLSLHHTEAVINGEPVPIARVVARAKASTWRLAADGFRGHGHACSSVDSAAEAEDTYSLHAALTRLLGALPEDETAALEKVGAR